MKNHVFKECLCSIILKKKMGYKLIGSMVPIYISIISILCYMYLYIISHLLHINMFIFIFMREKIRSPSTFNSGYLFLM